MISIRQVDDVPLSDMLTNLNEKEVAALDQCQELSMTSFAVLNDDDLLCVWGVICPSILGSEAYLWLHVTPNVQGNQFVFVRHSQRILEQLLLEYDAVVGHVLANAEQSKRWLKLLGAKFSRGTGPLLSFRIERKWQTH